MGTAMRRTRDPLRFFSALEDVPHEHDFFQTLRELEALYPDKPRLGAGPRPQDEMVRLGQDPSMSFAATAISEFQPGNDKRFPRLLVSFFGLLGPNGPMPTHITEFVRERAMHHNDPTFLRFLDILHHRLLSLFYRAWAQAQPTVSFDRPRSDRFADYVGALIGTGAPQLRGRDTAGDRVKQYFSGWFSRQVRNADGLRSILAGFFQLPVEIETFVGHWMTLPDDDLTRIGRRASSAQLGVGAVLGRRVWDRQHKIRVHLGPLSLSQYEAFLPGGEALPQLVALLRSYLNFEFEWDLRLVLAVVEVPRTTLRGFGRLGWTSWVGTYRKPQAAADLTLDAERLVGAMAA